MKNILKPSRQILAACLLIALASAQAAPSYEATLVTKSDNFTFHAGGMNDNAQVFGNVSLAWPDAQAAIVRDGQVQLIGPLPGTNYSFGTVMNTQGDILGKAYNAVSTGTGANFTNEQPFIYRNGTLSPLSNVLGPNAKPLDMNNADDLVGHVVQPDGQTKSAFVYSNGQMTMLGQSNWKNSSAQVINNTGTVAGVYDRPTDPTLRVFVNQNGQSQVLGAFGNTTNTVVDINDQGQLLITGDQQAVLYDAGKTVVLGSTAEPFFAGNANQIQTRFTPRGLGSNGTVVGTLFSTEHYNETTVLYTEGQQWDLNDLLVTTLPPGRVISYVLDIDEHNRILALDQSLDVYLLTPMAAVPEPDQKLLMITGLLGLAAAIRLRKR
jgi:hypothetical protein